jgi:hypothetical protein
MYHNGRDEKYLQNFNRQHLEVRGNLGDLDAGRKMPL